MLPEFANEVMASVRHWKGSGALSGAVAGAFLMLIVTQPGRTFMTAVPVVLLAPALLLITPVRDKAVNRGSKSGCGRGSLWEFAARGHPELGGGAGGEGGREGECGGGAGEEGDIAAELKELMDLVMRDIIGEWYRTSVSAEDREFLVNLDEVIGFAIHTLASRMKDIPMARLACSVEEALGLLKEHSRCHNAAVGLLSPPDASSTQEEQVAFEASVLREYERIVTLPAVGLLHPGCKDPSHEVRFWRGVFGKIIPLLLPHNTYNSFQGHSRIIENGAIAIGSDLLSLRAMLPLTDLLSDPHFLNNIVVSLAAKPSDSASGTANAGSSSNSNGGAAAPAAASEGGGVGIEGQGRGRGGDGGAGGQGLDSLEQEAHEREDRGWSVERVGANAAAERPVGALGRRDVSTPAQCLTDSQMSTASVSDIVIESVGGEDIFAIKQDDDLGQIDGESSGEEGGAGGGGSPECEVLTRQQHSDGEEESEEEAAAASDDKKKLRGESQFVESCPVPTKAVIVSASVVSPGDGAAAVGPGVETGMGGTKGSTKYAVYVMEVTRSDLKGNIVARRYMDFFRLHTILSNGASREIMQRLKLPSKRIFTLGSLTEAFLQERKELLQQYLDRLLSCQELAQSIPVKFFLIPHAAGPVDDAFYASQTMREVAGEGKPWGKKKGGFMSLSIARGPFGSSSHSGWGSPSSSVGRVSAKGTPSDANLPETPHSTDSPRATSDRHAPPHTPHTTPVGEPPNTPDVTMPTPPTSGGTPNNLVDGTPNLSMPAEPPPSSAETLAQQFGGGRSSSSSRKRTASPDGRQVQISAGDVSDALMALLDDVLELGGRGWLRRRTHNMMMVLLNATSYDLSIESRCLGIVEEACSEASLSGMIRALRQLVWPGEGPIAVGKAPRPTDEERAQRASESCDAMQSLLRRSPIAIMLSRASVDRAGLRLFSIAQSRPLNKHMVLCLLEIVLRLVFPELEDRESQLEQGDQREQGGVAQAQCGANTNSSVDAPASGAGRHRRNLSHTPNIEEGIFTVSRG